MPKPFVRTIRCFTPLGGKSKDFLSRGPTEFSLFHYTVYFMLNTPPSKTPPN